MELCARMCVALQCAAGLALLAFTLWSGSTAVPCKGFEGLGHTECESRLRHFEEECADETEKQPYWLMLASASIKSAVSMKMFGPPSPAVETAHDTIVLRFVINIAMKRKAKLAFQIFLLVLCVYSLVVDTIWLFTACLTQCNFPLSGFIIRIASSGNLVTGYTCQAFLGVYNGAYDFKISLSDHPLAKEEGAVAAAQWHREICTSDGKVIDRESTFRRLWDLQGPVATIYLVLAWVCYVVIPWSVVGIYLVFAFVWYFYAAYPCFLMCFFAGHLQTALVIRLYKQKTIERHPLIQDFTVERKRAVLMRLGEPAQALMNDIPKYSGFTADEVKAQFKKECEVYNLTGAPNALWEAFFSMTFAAAVAIPALANMWAKVVITMNIQSMPDLYFKLIKPVFCAGEERDALVGSHLQILLLCFWERRVDLFIQAMMTSLSLQVAFLNSLI